MFLTDALLNDGLLARGKIDLNFLYGELQAGDPVAWGLTVVIVFGLGYQLFAAE